MTTEPSVAVGMVGSRLTREEVESTAVACILTDHGACDYDSDCRCECHRPEEKP